MKLTKEINLNEPEKMTENDLKSMYENRCLHPKWIQSKINNKYIAVRCDNCIKCRINKITYWDERLINEIETDDTNTFVIMYINENSIEELKKVANNKKIEITNYKLFNQIATIAIRRFLEIWRKKTGTSVKHWFTTELTNSETNKIKIRGIIFNNNLKQIITSWRYGKIMFSNNIDNTSIVKLLKYTSNTNVKTKYYKPIVLCSPKIGKNTNKKAS